MEAAAGFEPAGGGVAIPCVGPLRHTAGLGSKYHLVLRSQPTSYLTAREAREVRPVRSRPPCRAPPG